LEEEAQALEKANKDFRTIAADHRVTLYWLEVPEGGGVGPQGDPVLARGTGGRGCRTTG